MTNKKLTYLFLAVLWLGVFNTLKGAVADPDLWGYLAFGRLFWFSSSFPYYDTFAYTPTLSPWVYHEWLTGVIYYPIYQALGLPALQVLKYLLGLAAASMLFHIARKRGAGVVATGLILWISLMFIAMGYNPTRAQCWTFLFFTIFLYVLEFPSWPKLLLLPVLMVLWANMHGGFVVGLGVMGIYVIGNFVQRKSCLSVLVTMLLCLVATFINPYGWTYWTYIIHALAMPRPEITEWASAWRSYRDNIYWGSTFYFLVMVLFAVSLAARQRWSEITQMLFLGITLVLGFKAVRHQPFFFMACAAYLPRVLQEYLDEIRYEPWTVKVPWRALAIPILIVGLGLNFWTLKLHSLTLDVPQEKQITGIAYPVKAVDYIKTNKLTGSLMTVFAWGEYVLWELAPNVKVAVDGRYETVYPKKVCDEYFDCLYGRIGWEQFLRNYPPNMVLVSPDCPLIFLLTESKAEGIGSWELIYNDQTCLLFKRKA